jgi:DNA-binding GntR family transcriptional regulator
MIIYCEVDGLDRKVKNARRDIVMPVSETPVLKPTPLIKENLATLLREEIISGRIAPGDPIVEGRRAAELNVSQGSVREALNILVAEGFVEKGSGHSAKVIELTAQDVAEIYQIRARLEGLAAAMVTQNGSDLADLEEVIREKTQAAAEGNMTALLSHDLRFHLLLCEKSRSRFLYETAKRLLVPLFAFVRICVHSSKQGPNPWQEMIPLHSQILDVIRLGDPVLAEQFVTRVTLRFGNFAYDIWDNKTPAPRPTSRAGN